MEPLVQRYHPAAAPPGAPEKDSARTRKTARTRGDLGRKCRRKLCARTGKTICHNFIDSHLKTVIYIYSRTQKTRGDRRPPPRNEWRRKAKSPFCHRHEEEHGQKKRKEEHVVFSSSNFFFPYSHPSKRHSFEAKGNKARSCDRERRSRQKKNEAITSPPLLPLFRGKKIAFDAVAPQGEDGRRKEVSCLNRGLQSLAFSQRSNVCLLSKPL